MHKNQNFTCSRNEANDELSSQFNFPWECGENAGLKVSGYVNRAVYMT